jgi:hypothetical protein
MSEKNDLKVDFIGIGSAKCATTWVYRCLIEHPQICGNYVKELNFFLTRRNPFSEEVFDHYKHLYHDGINSYLERFEDCPKDSVKGEISVHYISDPGTPGYIHKYFPNVKILVFLRDPVKRAYSYYWYARKFTLKEKNKSFEEALNDKISYELYINRGMYYKHLKRYYDIFPRQNIGVFLIDDLKKDPVKFMQKVYDFLQVDANFIAPSCSRKENTARVVKFIWVRKVMEWLVYRFYDFLRLTRLYIIKDLAIKLGLQKFIYYTYNQINVESFKKPPINPETEKRLREIFREDINNLEKLINRDLGNWK